MDTLSKTGTIIGATQFYVTSSHTIGLSFILRLNAARSVEAEPGCLRFDILVPENPLAQRTVLLYEIYTDRAAFDDHLASDHYMKFDAETRDMVTDKNAVPFRVSEHSKQPMRR